jgi:putative hydrolase of the HAD superfamily
MGFPKEQLEFWKRAEKKIGFRRESTLFVDDTLAVLRTAKQFGIGYIVYKAKGNSTVPPGHNRDFATVMNFSELM